MADGGAARWRGRPQRAQTSGAETRPGAAPEAPSPSLDQWQGPASIRLRLWVVDAADRGGAGRAEVPGAGGRDRRGALARPVRHHAAETLAARLSPPSLGDQTLHAHD